MSELDNRLNEKSSIENLISPDLRMCYGWLKELCNANGIDNPEDLPTFAIEDEIADTTLALEIELEDHKITRNESFIATLKEHLEIMKELREMVLSRKTPSKRGFRSNLKLD